jgi:hypothetical protein
MLQHNICVDRIAPRRDAGRAHLVHAAVVGGHLLCCGAPIAMALLTMGLGVSMGIAAVAQWFGAAHVFLHAHEIWMLGLSAGLVLVGGALEARAHRGRRISALFAVSLLCFTLNAGLVWGHRDAPLAHSLAAEAG